MDCPKRPSQSRNEQRGETYIVPRGGRLSDARTTLVSFFDRLLVSRALLHHYRDFGDAPT